MSDQPNPNLSAVAHMRGLGPQLLFAVDTKSQPGKWVCHFIRFETIVFNNDPTLEATSFKMIHPDNDARFNLLVGSFEKGNR